MTAKFSYFIANHKMFEEQTSCNSLKNEVICAHKIRILRSSQCIRARSYEVLSVGIKP